MRDFDQILDECVNRINSGEGLEECLASYPEWAEELEPALRAIFDIRAAYSFTPRPGAKATAKQRLYAALDSLERKRQERPLTVSGFLRYIGVRRVKMRKAFGIIAAVSVLALLIVGLVVLLPSAAKTGTLKLYLSDAPIDAENVTGVYITINEIQYHLGSENDGEWKTLEEFEGPQTYNLLELTGGDSAWLGDFKLEAGHYTQIRFLLDIQEDPNQDNSGCYIEFDDNSTTPLFFYPSGGQTGYKAVGEFTVPLNGEVEVTADWDVRKGVVEAGEKYILKPTIRLIVNNQAGNIAGSIINAPDDTDIVVYAYEDGTWDEAEELANPTELFPNAVTSGKMDEEDHYILALLAPVTYDLVVAEFDGETFGAVLGFISDVEVQSEQTTTLNIDISAL